MLETLVFIFLELHSQQDLEMVAKCPPYFLGLFPHDHCSLFPRPPCVHHPALLKETSLVPNSTASPSLPCHAPMLVLVYLCFICSVSPSGIRTSQY